MAEHTLPDNRPNERQAEGDGSTQSPLSREALLQLEHDDPARQNAIIERAIHLLPKAPRDIHDDEDLVSSNRGPSTSTHDVKAETEMNSNDKVYNTLKNAKDRWVTSRDAQDLRAQLAQVVKEGKLVGVKKIVCFGLGPPALWDHCDPPNGDGSQEEVTSRSLVQHIAALVMAETINQASGSGSGNITVYSQEPLYRPEEDMPALEAHGIQVLDGHKGFVSVDQDTLVFAPAPTLKVYQVICETARPAGIIFILAVVPANTRKRLHAIFDVLDLEYDMYLDWPPFYHPVYHGNYKPMPWGAPRPLSGCIVWLRKAEVWSEDALVSSGR